MRRSSDISNDGNYIKITIDKLKEWGHKFPVKNGPQLTISLHTKQVNEKINKQIDELVKKVSKSTSAVEAVLELVEYAFHIIRELKNIQQAQQYGSQKYHTGRLKELKEYLRNEFCNACLDRNSSFIRQEYEIRSDTEANARVAAYFKEKNIANNAVRQNSYTEILQVAPVNLETIPEKTVETLGKIQEAIVKPNTIPSDQQSSLEEDVRSDFMLENNNSP